MAICPRSVRASLSREFSFSTSATSWSASSGFFSESAIAASLVRACSPLGPMSSSLMTDS